MFVWSIIGRVIALIAVLAFVFGIVYITQNTKFLWLLFLIFTIELIPKYEIVEVCPPTVQSIDEEEIFEEFQGVKK